jgi:hypothetical protein
MNFKTINILNRLHIWQIKWENLSLNKSLLKHADRVKHTEAIRLGLWTQNTPLDTDLQKYIFYINYAFHSKLIFITSHDLGVMLFGKKRI